MDEDESHVPLSPGEARKLLYERQRGRCKGCERVLPMTILTFDWVDGASRIAGRRHR